MTRGLAAGLFFLASWSLLAAQGARAGPYFLPPLSPWWLVGAAVVLVFAPGERDARLPRGAVLSGIGLVVSFFVVVLFRAGALLPRTSLEVLVDGEREATATSLELERRAELFRIAGRRRSFDLQIDAVLEVPRAGRYRFEFYCDDSCDVALGSRSIRVEGSSTDAIRLEKGDVPVSIRYRQDAGPAALVVRWDRPGPVELLGIDYYLRSPGSEPRSRSLAHVALAAFALWWAALGVYLARVARGRSQWLRSPLLPAACAVLLVVYGAALRLDALLAHSRLAEDARFAPVHEALLPFLPSFGVLNPENAPDDPYRADVRSYLDRARSMTLGELYAPSFREPFYVLLTQAFVGITGGEIGILVQSLVFSVLTLPLFYAVARSLHGPLWAAALLLPVSLHEWLVLESPTGYRMSAYSFFLLLLTWLVCRDGKRAPLTGALAGLLSLIRLSAVTIAAPLLALRLAALEKRERLRYGAGFLVVFLLLVAPFLVSNYRAHGDPFYSISFHTEFWLRAEGLDEGQGPVSLSRYFTDFGRAGSLLKGTFLGLTLLPLRTFWNGLRWLPALGAPTLALGIVGLARIRAGKTRYLTAAYFGHLLPFAYIQNFPSGEMPRFVMPAYFLLVLAIPAAVELLHSRLRRVR